MWAGKITKPHKVDNYPCRQRPQEKKVCCNWERNTLMVSANTNKAITSRREKHFFFPAKCKYYKTKWKLPEGDSVLIAGNSNCFLVEMYCGMILLYDLLLCSRHHRLNFVVIEIIIKRPYILCLYILEEQKSIT